ncbi:MAG: hypothetical protein V1696_02205 [Candidatus Jorgensenbacteria bacterium]
MTATTAVPTAHQAANETLHKSLLGHFEDVLAEMKQDLIERQRSASAQLSASSDAAERVGDGELFHVPARDEVLAELRIVGSELPKVQLALRRVLNDLKGVARDRKFPPFGRCLEPKCSNWIVPERLDAVPHTPTCERCSGCSCVSKTRGPHRN